jgi:hypothetical protein
MKAKPNQIKLVFAPETEFQVHALTIPSEGRPAEEQNPAELLNLSSEIEFRSFPAISSSALND